MAGRGDICDSVAEGLLAHISANQETEMKQEVELPSPESPSSSAVL